MYRIKQDILGVEKHRVYPTQFRKNQVVNLDPELVKQFEILGVIEKVQDENDFSEKEMIEIAANAELIENPEVDADVDADVKQDQEQKTEVETDVEVEVKPETEVDVEVDADVVPENNHIETVQEKQIQTKKLKNRGGKQ